MCRAFIVSIAAIFLLSACSSTPVKETSSTKIVTAPATAALVPAAQLPTSMPATELPTVQPTIQTEWFSRLETISPQNWARLQLLQTFPAEMPMNHSAVTIAPDRKTMVIGSSSRAQLFFFDLESGRILPQSLYISGVANADRPFNVIEYLSDGTILANSDGPYTIYHIDGAGNVLSTWTGIDFAVSADDKIMAFGTAGGITLVDIASNETMISLNGREAMGASFSPDNSKIAINVITVQDISIDIWDIASQTILTRLDQAGNASYSPNGKFLAATGYEDNATSLKIFTPDGTTQLTTLKASDPKGLNGMAPVFSPDASIIAAQIGNGSPIAWDTTNWQLLETPALEGELSSFSSDGRNLVTRTHDGGILIWGVLP